MPQYTCEKCAKVFKQKSHYTDHISKKNDCSKTTGINEIIETKVREVVKTMSTKPEVTKETLPSFFEDIHNLLWNRAGLNPQNALEHLIFFFAYRMIESQADTLNLPKECRWSYLISLKSENDLFEAIKAGVASFRKNKKTKHFFEPHKIQKAEVVYDIVQEINRISLKTLQETDTLGDIFEYMIGRGMSTMADEGQYFTNRAICRLAFKLSYDIKKNLRRADGSLCTFGDWFCGTGGFTAEYVKGVNSNLPDINWKKDCNSIYSQDMNSSSVITTLLNLLILTGTPFNNENIRSANSFSDPITMGETAPFKGVTLDYSFMNPPYGGDKTKGKEYKFAYSKRKGTDKQYLVNQEIRSIGIEDDDKVSAGVQLAMATLSADGGVSSIVLPQGFFFGASKKCVELRKKIAEDYRIHYVVDIASGAFLNTGTKTSMMVFQKGVGATEKVAFIGLDEKPLAEATLEELRAKNYSLNYKQYLPQDAVEIEGFDMVKLGDIVNIHFGERITKKDNIGTLYPVYGGGNDTFRTDKKNREGISCKVSRFGISEHNCVQIIYGEYWLMDSGFTITAKADKAIDSYIWNWLVQNKQLVYSCGRATAQMNMDMDTFKNLTLPLPSLETQQKIVESIDGFTQLAHQEEESLKLLEKQVMLLVKMMGRGKERVKLGEVCEIKYGDKNTTHETTELYPGIGGGIAPSSYVHNWNIEEYTSIISRSGSAGHISRYPTKASAGSFAFVCLIKNDKVIVDYLYFVLKNEEEYIKTLPEGTVQKNLNRDVLRGVELQIPPLTEQQTLQSDFDEIRHKHKKIAEYKAKAHEAIQRLIPGAKKPENEIITPIVEAETETKSEASSVEDKPKRKRPQVAKN